MKKTDVRSIRRLQNLNPVFHKKTKEEDVNVVSVVLLRQARKCGKLNLSSKHLAIIPDEVFKLGDVHSDDNNVDIDGDSKKDSSKWWELEPLTYLDLSSNCITVVPPQINQLDSLTVLNLHNNSIERVPLEVGHLQRLTNLDLAHNKLTQLPDELSGLKELRNLNVSYNAFKTIPSCVYDLVMLENLDLCQNQIETMPPGIGFLIRLTKINVSHNKLQSVPPDLSNCKALLDLDLSHNSITTEGLPPLGDLHNVQVIQLQYNKLTLLPKLNGCSSLKEIHLAFNQMKEITIEELSTLSHLQIINLRDNKLEKLPKEMSCMQNLLRLDLTNNSLKELPATLGLLPHLQNLLVEGNGLRTIRRDIITGGTQRLLKHLKQTLPLSEEDMKLVGKLPCHSQNGFPDRFTMRSSRNVNLAAQDLCTVPDSVFVEAVEVPCNMVDLSKNKLRSIPTGLWLLRQHLTDLNLSHNQLLGMGEELGECVNIAYLSVANNQLQQLPQGLVNCPRLREVNISNNKFTEIPESLYSIKGLEILLASDNKIADINIERLLTLTHLATLDLCNNNISNVPPRLGNMTQIRSLGLDGNGLRAPRAAILAKGTDAVLSWLRDKIPLQ